ncbi:DinB family protein [Thermoflavimicrobium daqui]|jgi:hypothetical protein|uniref:DinB-like domain-containing protein n=1 Tax=Thermoflavimicrobium daqui TaxID=2137476 RepID=A0A364K4A5_9BACL|nr:DinB family protein [Thermoflavimicrobium daqui]RAL24167.1 hypothetical protein DL897_10810 [Thermoflavimicrobium daqui]
MNTQEVLETFSSLTGYYANELEKYSTEQLTWKPTPIEWSIAQVYQHLIDSTRYFFLQIEHCARGEKADWGEKTDVGKEVFAKGEFPNIRVKLPNDSRFVPDNPTDKNAIKQQLFLVIEKMKELEPTISSIPKDRTRKHLVFGHLTAEEWFQLIPMHVKHHLRQKERLDQQIFY